MSAGTRYLAEKAELEHRIRNGARWFYLLAGLGMVGGIIGHMELGIKIPFAFGITSFANNLVSLLGEYVALLSTSTIMFASGLAAILFVFIGYFAERRSRIAFFLGFICYLGDGILLFNLADYVALGFHIFVLYFLFQGMRATAMLKHYERARTANILPDATISMPKKDAFAKDAPGSNNTVGIKLVKREWDTDAAPAK